MSDSGWRASAGAAPWTQPRWFEDAERWLRSCLASLGYQPTGPVGQVQVWELSCVLRAPTAQGDVYFKATADSPLFVNEGVVMRVLAELFGDRVPRPLAVDAERRWMLLADVGEQLGGDEHGAGVPVEVREDVLLAFARLQVDAAEHAGRLLAEGCTDRRLARLAGEAERWLPAIEATGRLPGIDAATWLTAAETAELRAWRLAEPLVALHQAVSYRSIVANLRPPIDRHMMQSAAYWLRKVIAAPAGGPGEQA